MVQNQKLVEKLGEKPCKSEWNSVKIDNGHEVTFKGSVREKEGENSKELIELAIKLTRELSVKISESELVLQNKGKDLYY